MFKKCFLSKVNSSAVVNSNLKIKIVPLKKQNKLIDKMDLLHLQYPSVEFRHLMTYCKCPPF